MLRTLALCAFLACLAVVNGQGMVNADLETSDAFSIDAMLGATSLQWRVFAGDNQLAFLTFDPAVNDTLFSTRMGTVGQSQSMPVQNSFAAVGNSSVLQLSSRSGEQQRLTSTLRVTERASLTSVTQQVRDGDSISVPMAGAGNVTWLVYKPSADDASLDGSCAGSATLTLYRSALGVSADGAAVTIDCSSGATIPRLIFASSDSIYIRLVATAAAVEENAVQVTLTPQTVAYADVTERLIPSSRSYEGASGSMLFFLVSADRTFRVRLTPDSGDPDLYASTTRPFADESTWSTWRSQASRSSASTSVDSMTLPAGDWYIGIYGFASYEADMDVEYDDYQNVNVPSAFWLGADNVDTQLSWSANMTVIIQGTRAGGSSTLTLRSGGTTLSSSNGVITLPPTGGARSGVIVSRYSQEVRTAYVHPLTPAGGLGSAGTLSSRRFTVHQVAMGSYRSIFLYPAVGDADLYCSPSMPSRPLTGSNYVYSSTLGPQIADSVEVSPGGSMTCLVHCFSAPLDEQCVYHIWTNATGSRNAFADGDCDDCDDDDYHYDDPDDYSGVIAACVVTLVVLVVCAVARVRKSRAAVSSPSVELREQLSPEEELPAEVVEAVPVEAAPVEAVPVDGAADGSLHEDNNNNDAVSIPMHMGL